MRLETSPLRRSSHLKTVLFLIVSVAIVVVGLILLVINSGAEYYKHVDELMKNPSSLQSKSIRIHGFVSPGTIEKTTDSVKQQWVYHFQMENCGSSLKVNYPGVVPDTFRDGAEVVVKGKTKASPIGWVFEATEVIGKCPSKYSQDTDHMQAQANRCTHEQEKK